MYRAIIVLLIVCALSLYVRHQFQTVIHQITTKAPPVVRPQPQESRRKCVLCGGTGRLVYFNLSRPNGSSTTQVCPTCNGTGWVDNPVFGR